MEKENGGGIDSARASAAMITSRGMGLGQIEAQRFLGALTPEQRGALAVELQGDVSLAQKVAQRRSVPFADYVGELVAKGEVEESAADLHVLYRAGFDIGFAARLVEEIESEAAENSGVI